ncbi:MAG: hypothetical protein LBB90_10445 [Tannerella sp.]|jgi:hypothetical protein|nr:hypothetical protein [Tannerella sp.]
MNGLTEIVSDSITGGESRVIGVRGRFYRVKAPTPYTLGRMLKPLGKLEVDEKENRISLIQKSVAQYPYMDSMIALAILGDVPLTLLNQWRLWRLKRRFRRSEDAERLAAFKEILSIITPNDFFLYARLAMELTLRMVNTKPSEDGR